MRLHLLPNHADYLQVSARIHEPKELCPRKTEYSRFFYCDGDALTLFFNYSLEDSVLKL